LKTSHKLLYILAGIILTSFVITLWNNFTKKTEEAVQNDYYIITNQIRKMNKMVVMENHL